MLEIRSGNVSCEIFPSFGLEGWGGKQSFYGNWWSLLRMSGKSLS
jgi:hypothetical protein